MYPSLSHLTSSANHPHGYFPENALAHANEELLCQRSLNLPVPILASSDTHLC